MGKTKRKRSLKQRTHRKQRKYVARYRKTTKRQKRRKTRKRLKGGGDTQNLCFYQVSRRLVSEQARTDGRGNED